MRLVPPQGKSAIANYKISQNPNSQFDHKVSRDKSGKVEIKSNGITKEKGDATIP